MTGRDKLGLDLEGLVREQELYENPLTEKQRHILTAAERLFAEAGYAETSTASIAKEAGVTEKTLFKHFPTKQDLFRRILFPLILKTVIPLQIKIVRKVLGSEHKTFPEFFESLARDRWGAARHLGPKLKLVLSEALRNDKLRGELFGLATKHVWPELVHNVEKFQRSGELRDDISAEDIARMQVGAIMIQALLRAVVAPQTPRDDARDAKLIADMLMDGIRARSSAAS